MLRMVLVRTMSSDNAEIYIMQDDEDQEGWVRPTRASVAILETVAAKTNSDRDHFDELESYLDLEELDAVLRSDEGNPYEFTIEGHDVMVAPDGEVTVSE